jgi:hypothetical protein
MKILVIKKASGRVRDKEICPWLVEAPPEPRK